MGCGSSIGGALTLVGAGVGAALSGGTAAGIGLGATIGSAAGSIAGGLSSQGLSNKMSAYQGQLTQAQYNVAKSDLNFQKQIYEQWKETYGALEKDIAESLNNLNTKEIEELGLEDIQRSFIAKREQQMLNLQKAIKQAKITAAQRGLSEEDGLVLDIAENLQNTLNETIQNNILNEQLTEYEKQEQMRFFKPDLEQNFLGMGEGVGGMLQGQVNRVASSVTQGYGTIANLMSQQGQMYHNVANNMWGNVGSALTGGLRILQHFNQPAQLPVNTWEATPYGLAGEAEIVNANDGMLI